MKISFDIDLSQIIWYAIFDSGHIIISEDFFMSHIPSTKQRLMTCAIKLFKEKSYSQTKVEEICQAAQTAKGSFFYYFERKELILKEILDEQVRHMANHLQQALDTNHKTPKEKIEMLLTILLSPYSNGPEALTYFGDEPIPEWFETMSHQARDKYIYPLILSITQEGELSKDFNIDYLETTTEIVYQGINMYMHQHFKELYHKPFHQETTRSIAALLEKVLGLNAGTLNFSKEVFTFEKTTTH